jgi:DNA-directed RNA polymerase specialized sigma24 family protein
LLDRYSKEKASFRTFLKVLLKHFAEHRDRALGRLKRGGGVLILDLDRAGLPLKDAIPASRAAEPVEEFERAWRNEVVARAMERVRERLKADGREAQFQIFEAYDLAAPPDPPSYDEVAARFGRTPSDVRNYLHAVRQLLRLEIQAELARTTSGPEELEDEWNALFGS